jgi:DNA (cytosine-5)-methyltransferase 1
MADTSSERRQQVSRSPSSHEEAHGRAGWLGGESNGDYQSASDGEVGAGRVAHKPLNGWRQGGTDGSGSTERGGQEGRATGSGLRGSPSELANPIGQRLEGRSLEPAREEREATERGGDAGRGDSGGLGYPPVEQVGVPGLSREHGDVGDRGGDFWTPSELVHCLDGKSRRIEPGTFPLAHGVPARVAKLRALGNAIVPQVAAEVLKAWMEAQP